MSSRLKVEVRVPGEEVSTRYVANLDTWLLRMDKTLPLGTRITVFKGPGMGTWHFVNDWALGFRVERETFGPVNS